MKSNSGITLARIYDPNTPGTYRVLVDRLWPRGITKQNASLDGWLKDVAPSTELRRWYGHQLARFDEFAHSYQAELCQPPALNAVNRLLELGHTHRVVLLTATRDIDHSGANVLYGHLVRLGTEE